MYMHVIWSKHMYWIQRWVGCIVGWLRLGTLFKLEYVVGLYATSTTHASAGHTGHRHQVEGVQWCRHENNELVNEKTGGKPQLVPRKQGLDTQFQ